MSAVSVDSQCKNCYSQKSILNQNGCHIHIFPFAAELCKHGSLTALVLSLPRLNTTSTHSGPS